MTPLFWAGAGVIIAAMSAALSYISAIRSARKENRQRRDEEIEAQTQTLLKLNTIGEDINDLSERVNSIASDVSDLKVTVAVHDDRFKRPLRAVNGE